MVFIEVLLYVSCVGLGVAVCLSSYVRLSEVPCVDSVHRPVFVLLTASSAGPRSTTTSQPIYCQGGRKYASLVQLGPEVVTSQIWVTTSTVCNPPFEIVTVLILSAMVASWHPSGATLAEGRSGTLCNPVQSPVLHRLSPCFAFRFRTSCCTSGKACPTTCCLWWRTASLWTSSVSATPSSTR